ncbi:MAG: hypothetical protein CMN79_01470 [Spirochaetales bacterium]|nr:hypothetical protein [Spirochaetales bacterium]
MVKYKEYPCDLCGSQEAVEVPYVRHYTDDQPIHICKKCGFVYVKMRRTSKEIAKMWSEEIFGEGYTAKIPAVKARQTYIAEFIKEKIGLRDKEICDIGTGEGQFLEIISKEEYGAKVFGTEASKTNCESIAMKGFRHFYGTIEDFCVSPDEKEYKADIVTIMWTLENCVSCRDMLSGAHQILKDNGYLVVAGGSRILVPFKKPLHLLLREDPVDTHPIWFSANTLQGLLAVSGFEVKHVNSYIDSDPLCMIAKKKDKSDKINWQGDDFKKVHGFFERWHKENKYYK